VPFGLARRNLKGIVPVGILTPHHGPSTRCKIRKRKDKAPLRCLSNMGQFMSQDLRCQPLPIRDNNVPHRHRTHGAEWVPFQHEVSKRAADKQRGNWGLHQTQFSTASQDRHGQQDAEQGKR
jgi:hypothetical protein